MSVLLPLLAALLGLCVLVAAVALRQALRQALAWMDGELCPICERPVERCAGHEIKN